MNHSKHQHHTKNHHEKHNINVHDNHGEHHGHHDHHGHMIDDFKKKFLVCLSLTLPILLLSPMIQSWLGINWSFTGSKYLLSALSAVVFFYGGIPFFKGTNEELKKKKPGMMTLIGVAISVAFLYSSAVVFGLEGKTFFWELSTLVDVMLLGHWIEMNSVMRSHKALETLATLLPDEANLIHDDHTMKVKVSILKNGDKILIKPGEKIPADGKIFEGSSEVNESMLTGESRMLSKHVGQQVIGGSINGNDILKVQISGTGKNSYLSKLINIVEDAQKKKSNTQKLADKAAFWLTIIALTMGFGTFVIWLLFGKELSFALERMVTVMVVCCPHALGMAIPLVSAISTSYSAKHGLLIKNRSAFENSRKISTIVFDKTGTLTHGSHQVMRVVHLKNGYTEKDIIQLSASVEQPSEHYISKGLQKKAKAHNLSLFPVQDFKYNPGVGISGKVKGKTIQVGGEGLIRKLNIDAPHDGKANSTETKIFILEDKTIIGFITFADQIRSSSNQALETLRKIGIKCLLLTGDNKDAASHVAKELKMENYYAGVLPEEKQKKIIELQNKNEFVAMVGDGINDAPALAQANVGIAIGSGTDVAAETADIILVDSDPKDIVRLILFGKATYKKIVENLAWATGYNVIALPLATGLIPGLMISPAVGAALMSLSTVVCAVNAQMLKYKMK